MPRRRSRRAQGGGLGLIALVVIIAGLWWVARDQIISLAKGVGIDLSKIPPIGQGVDLPIGTGVNPPASSEQTSGGGSYFDVYFTDPASYASDAQTGGIEVNLIKLIEGAQSSIDLAVFEFNLQDVADALIAAHQRGVTVRVVYDNEHTADDPQMDQMIKAGIPATPDQRSAFMHNKFFVIDRQIVWTGSWNVSINDTFKNNNNGIVLRSTKLADNYTAEFEEMFNGQFGPKSPANTPNPTITLNGIQIENYFAPEDDPMSHLIQFVSGAQKSIHFMAFSFTQDDLGKAVSDRGKAGVELVGVFDQTGAGNSECEMLLAQGFDMRLDGNPRILHHKVFIIDGSAVAFGSFNFSKNASDSNDENLLIVHDPALAAIYEQEFQRRFAEASKPTVSSCSK